MLKGSEPAPQMPVFEGDACCPVCLDPFISYQMLSMTQSISVPKDRYVIACGHSMCLECITLILSTHANSKNVSKPGIKFQQDIIYELSIFVGVHLPEMSNRVQFRGGHEGDQSRATPASEAPLPKGWR